MKSDLELAIELIDNLYDDETDGNKSNRLELIKDLVTNAKKVYEPEETE